MIVSTLNLSVIISGIATTLIQEADPVAADQELGPILEPDPIEFSFDTWGWYFVGILLILVCFFFALRQIKHYKKNAYRREALKELNQVNPSKSNNELGQQLTELLIILKVTAFKAYGRKNVATLYGKPWLLFLESKAKNTPFSKFEPIISRAIYKNETPDNKELNELKNLSKKWILTHA